MDDRELAALLRDAALSIRSGGGDEAVVARLRAALVDVDPDAGAALDAASLAQEWRGALWRSARSLSDDIEDAERTMKRLGDDGSPTSVAVDGRARTRLAVKRATLARVERLLSMRRDELAGEFLPFGTVVRLRADSFAASDAPGPRPEAGTLAVVTSYNPSSDRPLSVALTRTVPDTGGGMLAFDEERPWSFDVSLADVDVVTPALMADGSVNDRIGYVPTHRRPDGRDEMLVEAEGLVWRIVPKPGGPRFVRAYPGEAHLPWLTRIGDAPGSPRP